MFRLVSEAAHALATPPRWDGKFWEIANHVVRFTRITHPLMLIHEGCRTSNLAARVPAPLLAAACSAAAPPPPLSSSAGAVF